MSDKIKTKQQDSFPAITEWNQQVKWMTETRELSFTPEDIKREFSDNQNVSLKECVIFMQKCLSHRLDPYLGDAHLIKFGDTPAQLVVGKYAFLKIAKRSGVYNGCKAGVIVVDKNGKTIKREGCMTYDGEKLVGGWGQVFKKNEEIPDYDEVTITEYIKKIKSGEINSQWRNMPRTMIRKVGLVHALREAFPELRGMYDESEIPAIRSVAEGEKQDTKSRVRDIFNKKEKEGIIIEGEVVEDEKDEPDILLNQLKIYINALKIPKEKTDQWCKKAQCGSIEQLPPDIKQKCIDNLKPIYENLKKEEDIDGF